MNDSLGADPTEVLESRLQVPVPDTLEEIGCPDREEKSALKPSREGLPPSFRMRHDKHYVEELMSTPPVSEGTTYALSPRTAIPAAGVELIASRLEAVVAHGAISRGHAASTDLVSRTVEAELERVSRFARAVALNARQTEPIRRSVTIGEIAAAVRSACTRSARLHGMTFLVTTEDAGFGFAAERALIVQAIAGTVDALLDLACSAATDEGVEEGGRISVSLQAVRMRPALIVEIECPTLTWRTASADRFFENGEQDFGAAPAAGILLASAARVVRLHGGRVEAQLHRGGKLRYVFPQETPRATAS